LPPSLLKDSFGNVIGRPRDAVSEACKARTKSYDDLELELRASVTDKRVGNRFSAATAPPAKPLGVFYFHGNTIKLLKSNF